MIVTSTGALRVASRVWTPMPGRWALTVVCKATFRLLPGESPLDPEQEEPNEEDNYWDDDPERSLYSPCDLVPFKQRADVVLVGHAFAPGGAPARSIRTRLVVGDVDKAIEAFCDRHFSRDGELREGPPVARVSLRYERAAGGPSTSNPAGVPPHHRAGVPAFRADAYGSVHLPNLQPPGLHITSREDVIEPIGYGPLSPTWPTRADKLGPHRGAWDHTAWHKSPLPEGLDPAFFNVAPPDQQVSALRDRERIVLESLHPSHPRLVTSLSGARPAATVKRAGGPSELIGMLPDTLWIDTSRGICTVVWRGLIHLNFRDEPGQVVVSTEGAAGARPVWAPPAAKPPAADDNEELVSITRTDDPEPRRADPKDPDAAETAPIRADWSRLRPVMPFLAPAPEPPPDLTPPAPVAPWPPAPPLAPPIVQPPPVIEMAPPPPAPAKEPPPPDPAPAAKEPPSPPKAAPAAPYKTLEECAAIAASMARRRADSAHILEEHELSESDYTALDKRWSDLIREETSRGKTALLRAYDEAYVAQLERERGPIVVDEYARLAVASERGRAAEVLTELSLPRGALVRIERVWVTKLADDPELAAKARRAIEAARQA